MVSFGTGGNIRYLFIYYEFCFWFIYLFVAYFAVLLVSQITQDQKVRWFKYDKLERIWKEAIAA
jgi:hypothetical protein